MECASDASATPSGRLASRSSCNKSAKDGVGRWAKARPHTHTQLHIRAEVQHVCRALTLRSEYSAFSCKTFSYASSAIWSNISVAKFAIELRSPPVVTSKASPGNAQKKEYSFIIFFLCWLCSLCLHQLWYHRNRLDRIERQALEGVRVCVRKRERERER